MAFTPWKNLLRPVAIHIDAGSQEPPAASPLKRLSAQVCSRPKKTVLFSLRKRLSSDKCVMPCAESSANRSPSPSTWYLLLPTYSSLASSTSNGGRGQVKWSQQNKFLDANTTDALTTFRVPARDHIYWSPVLFGSQIWSAGHPRSALQVLLVQLCLTCTVSLGSYLFLWSWWCLSLARACSWTDKGNRTCATGESR